MPTARHPTGASGTADAPVREGGRPSSRSRRRQAPVLTHFCVELCGMHETPEELDQLQALLDASAAAAGPHLRGIITEERRLNAAELCLKLTGMRLLTVATVTADRRPLSGPFDGYFLHGSFWFSTSRNSVRARHLSRRSAVSVTHLPHERLAVSAHGDAALFDFPSPETAELREAMLDHYLPLQGPTFQEWLDGMKGGVAARVDASKLFVFHLGE